MAETGPSKADRNRWRSAIVRHLEDFPRQYAALENAMAAFGDDFDLRRFKQAFEDREDMEAYNRAQAVERALSRVQNYVAVLAASGVKLAGLPPSGTHRSEAERAFEGMNKAGIVNAALCRRLRQAQKARTRIEHGYVQLPAGDVHRAAELVHDAARDFIAAYRGWIGPLLEAA